MFSLSILLPVTSVAKPIVPQIDYYAEEKARQSFDLASSYYQNHLYQDALNESVKLIAQYPLTAKVADTLYLIGTIHADTANPAHDAQLAIQHWEQLLNRFPKYPQSVEVMMLIAAQWESLNDWHHAILEYDLVSARYPKDQLADDALFWSARGEAKLTHYPEAKKKWELIIRQYPTGTDDFYNVKGPFIDDSLAMVANVSLLMHDTTYAINAWQKIVDQYPDSPYRPFALFQLGKTYEETYYQPTVAITYYQKIVDTVTDSTWQRLARIKIDQIRKPATNLNP
ncbi:MAG: tetratricopeptide repeat protein [bacterium]